jgi:hypothetical protein
MKLAIVGSRDFDDYELVDKLCAHLVERFDVNAIVSGGAKGADKLGERFARQYGLDMIVFKPDWQQFGKRAGYLRNVDIIEASNIVIAFWDGQSKGTKHSIDIATKAKKFLIVVNTVEMSIQSLTTGNKILDNSMFGLTSESSVLQLLGCMSPLASGLRLSRLGLKPKSLHEHIVNNDMSDYSTNPIFNQENVQTVNRINDTFNKASTAKPSDCLHDNCSKCRGTGLELATGKMCVHNISCSCKKCRIS